MFKNFLPFLFFVMFTNVTYSSPSSPDLNNPLPIWIDKTKETSLNIPLPKMRGNPPPQSFRLPAEYEAARAVVIGWAGFTPMLNNITKAVTDHGNAELWIANGPYSIPNLPANKYSKLGCPLDTVWMRDYGPFGINEETGDLAVVDAIYRHYAYRRDDDKMPSCIADEKNVDKFPLNLILDGGNLMVDSKGNLFMTKRTYKWNSKMSITKVDRLLKEYFNVHTIHAIDYAGYPGSPDDGTGHIDMFVKLLGDSTVLITETSDFPYKKTCEKAVKYFQSIKAPNGKDYKIIKVKGWRGGGGTWYTYTNSLIVNNLVMIPSYSGHKDDDKKAQKAYEEGIPGIKAVMINSDSSIKSGGSIHCVTQLIPSYKK